MLTGESPFSTMEQTRIIGILMGEKPSPVEYVKQKLPPSSEQFLCKIFQSDPGARPTASDLFQNDSYLTAEKSLITMESIQDDKTINEEHDEQAVPSTNNSVIETAAVFNDESPLIRYFKDCKNYHNHHKFIPIKKFAKDSLPQSYQDSDLYETINLISELTVKLELKATSSKRPKFFPNTSVAYPNCSDSGMSSLRLGTGMVCWMEKFTDGYRFNGTKHKKFVTCPCTSCEYSPKCSKTWWEIQVQTAKQLVFDASEALATSCRIFDDGVQGSPAYYLKCLGVGNENIEMDLCRIKYVTCDANVAVKMDESLQGLNGLIKKVNRKYQSSKDGDKLAIIVAHPHGTSKHISIGKWREKKEVASEKKSFLKFTYTTSACEGSTGALVYCLGYSGIGWWESTLHGGAYHTELNHTGVTF